MTRLHVAIPLRWSDLDAYAHVNNARMFTLLEEARIAAFWGGGTNGAPTAVLSTGPGADSITLIAGQQIEYRAQIPFHREPLDVELWIGKLGGASLQVCYEVYSPAGHDPRTLYVRAATTIVLADRESGAPRRISDEERAVWLPFIDEPLEFRQQ
ncbi:acyl-CoA thioesterase [Microcella humidisoli]|jgi:acyl-CoA thioester hydrolase|uniref:Acyl-CoA thioesterase n=1 Tax=Microcella humidisoli TaxID=2963406 RepID=A0ABY5FVV5_9MICO|nr:thioesterase family protein [Microcella humidisoli]UTT61911.1 acyl-CoA thioesterase [Microcella humidisoli]